MILSFRPWWRILMFLGAVALLPLAWRGLERQPPILVQQIPAGSEILPPQVTALSQPPAAPAPLRTGLVAEAAAEAGGQEGGGKERPAAGAAVDAGTHPVATDDGPCARPSEPSSVGAEPGGGGEPESVAPGATPAAPSPGRAARVNINTADAATLETLPGIGPTLAARIIEYRERWGAFTAPDQLIEVSGIGEKRLEQLLPWITVE